MPAVFEWVAMMSAALFAGGALYISVVEHPARMKVGIDVARAEFGPSYRRAAPWQALSAALSLLAGLLAALTTSRWGWAVGGVLVGAAIPFTLIAVMPTTRRLLGGEVLSPEEATRLFRRWGRLHWVRSALGTLGLALLLWTASPR